MAMYEFSCPGDKKNKPHIFEKILPFSEQGKPQICPEHNKESDAIEYSRTNPFVWGYEEVHWSAGMSHNPNGMNHAKKPGKK